MIKELKQGKKYKIISLMSLGICIIIALWCYKTGLLTSIDKLHNIIIQLGLFGIILFILIQAVQVVVPILPGGISCLAGVVVFGAWKGFLFNYIGICIGSIIAFGISRYLGKPVLYQLFKRDTIKKYEIWTQGKIKFERLFALAIFFPVAPDDFLCYLAGTTKMKWHQFIAIIVFGKPFAIAMYSWGLTTVFNQLIGLK